MSRAASTALRRVALAALAATLAAFTAAGSAIAAADEDTASAEGLSIIQVDASRFPTVRVAFGADDVNGSAPDLRFHEGERELPSASLYRGELGEYEDERHTHLMLVLDTSLSMGFGTRKDDAIAAANALIDRARPGDRIGLATFGGDAEVVVPPSANLDRVRDALADVQLANRTTMFDAVSLAARSFDRDDRSANRAMVLLSDGKDEGSVESLDEAAGEAIKAQAPVFAVAIREDADDQPRDLAELGNGTGGELHTVVGSDGLDELFSDLGRRILQPYWVEYRSSAPQGRELQFGISAGSDDRPVVTKTFRATPTAAAAKVGDLPHATPPDPIVPVPGGLLGVLVAAAPFAVLVFSFVWMLLDRRTKPNVLARVERYTALASAETGARGPDGGRPLFARLAAPLMRVGDAFLGRSRFFEKIRARAEQAAIAIKPSELFAAMVGAGAIGAITGLLFAKVAFVLALGFVGFWAPHVWLRMKARRRRNAFEDQLPDVLQGISSSLKAGHSFNQAINAMIKDAPNPTSEEFSRVMTEGRLGMPIEDALQAMADRMGSVDFEFAVTTVNIQRTVGGSLADILQMVGDTVRNRQQFRKKVKALTSMGQMSAYVLLGMPVFIACALTLMNPAYMAPLFTTTTGHLMMVAGCVSMALGYAACMKIVKVKV